MRNTTATEREVVERYLRGATGAFRQITEPAPDEAAP